MTGARLRGRLRALEAKRKEGEAVEVMRLWWADLDAGLWREGVGPQEDGEEERGQTFPMSPEDLEDALASGQHVVMLTGLPHGVRS